MIRDYTIRYQIDTSSLGKSEADIKRAMDLITNGANKATAEVHQLESAAKNCATSFNGLNAAAGGLNVATGHGKSAQAAFMGINAELVKSVALFAAWDMFAGTIADVGNHARKVREEFGKMGDEVSKFRQEARELANLRGRDAPDNRTLAEAADFGLKAGMTPQQAVKFFEQFEGSLPAGLQKGNITRATADALAVDVGRFGQKVGLSQKTSGDLAGVLSQFAPIKSADEGLSLVASIAQGLNEGRGNLEPLMSSFVNLAGSTTDAEVGPIKDPRDLAALMGIASTHHRPREAATYTKIALREMRDFTGKSGDGLKQIGLTPDMDGMEAFQVMFKHLEDQEAQGIAPDQALAGLGMGRREGIQALTEMYRDRGAMEHRRAAVKDPKRFAGTAVRKQVDTFFKTRAGQKLLLDSQAAAARVDVGLKHEALQMARQAAATRMLATGTLKGEDAVWTDKVAEYGGLTTFLGFPSEIEKRIDQEAFNALETAAAGGEHEKQMAAEIGAARKGDNNAKAAFFDRWETKLTASGRGGAFGGDAGIGGRMRQHLRTPEQAKAWEDAKAFRDNPDAQMTEEWKNEILLRQGLKQMGDPGALDRINDFDMQVDQYKRAMRAMIRAPFEYYGIIQPWAPEGFNGPSDEYTPLLPRPQGPQPGGPPGAVPPAAAGAAAGGKAPGVASTGAAPGGNIETLLSQLIKLGERQTDILDDMERGNGFRTGGDPGFGPMRT